MKSIHLVRVTRAYLNCVSTWSELLLNLYEIAICKFFSIHRVHGPGNRCQLTRTVGVMHKPPSKIHYGSYLANIHHMGPVRRKLQHFQVNTFHIIICVTFAFRWYYDLLVFPILCLHMYMSFFNTCSLLKKSSYNLKLV